MVETVQGRVEATVPKRVKWGYAYYPMLVIHTASGPREFAKISAAGKVREVIEHGGEGTFYLSKHTQMLGIHGVKLADESKYYAHFNNMEWMFLLGAVVAVLGIVARLAGVEGFPLTPIVIGTIFAVFYPVIRNGRLQAKRAFDAV
ncbi:MAG: hypothetical protein ABIR25_08040 [Sphingomicrobium sp.]